MKSIIITTQSSLHHQWLAFSSWYSIHRNAPHIKVGVIFPRTVNTFHFNWLRKCDIPFIAYSKDHNLAETGNQLELMKCTMIPDYVMMIRSDDSNLDQWSPVTSKEPANLVDIRQFGKFSFDQWILTEKSHPFNKTAQLIGKERTVNEQKVIKLWRQMADAYDFLNR
jgi:hypothetical protein